MDSLSQGCVLKQEGQIEEEELTKETEKRAEREVENVNLAFPLSFPVPPQLRMKVPKKRMFEENKYKM